MDAHDPAIILTLKRFLGFARTDWQPIYHRELHRSPSGDSDGLGAESSPLSVTLTDTPALVYNYCSMSCANKPSALGPSDFRLHRTFSGATA